MEYLLNPNKRKSAAHYWDGNDTLCKMFSSGGMGVDRQQVFGDNHGRPICLMCSNVAKRGLPITLGRAHNQDTAA